MSGEQPPPTQTGKTMTQFTTTTTAPITLSDVTGCFAPESFAAGTEVLVTVENGYYHVCTTEARWVLRSHGTTRNAVWA